MYMPSNLTEEQTRAWCAYLASFHTAHAAMGNTVALPISPLCTNLTKHFGCGTCYACTEQVIMRALFTTTIATPENIPAQASAINNAVFDWVTGLDPERLRDEDGDNYVRMTAEQYTRVMNWAATFVRHPVPAPQRTYTAPAISR